MENDSDSIQKKKRSANWLDQDKTLLQDLVRERVSVIENKDTDTNTNSHKQKAWLVVQERFNNVCTGGSRTIAQLKSQWGVIKMVAKKELCQQRSQILKTGGGPPPEIKPVSSSDISAWLPGEFEVDYNEFDSDLNEMFQVKTLYFDNEMVDDDKKTPPLMPEKTNFNSDLSQLAIPKQTKKISRKRKTLNPKEGVADTKIKKNCGF